MRPLATRLDADRRGAGAGRIPDERVPHTGAPAALVSQDLGRAVRSPPRVELRPQKVDLLLREACAGEGDSRSAVCGCPIMPRQLPGKCSKGRA